MRPHAGDETAAPVFGALGAASVVLAAAAWLAVAPPARADQPVGGDVTWVRDVAPLLERRCVGCHVAGGYARFPLTTHAEARQQAAAIKEQVLSNAMPPWGALPEVGQFANDRRLTARERDLIAAWVDAGAPLDGGADTQAGDGDRLEAERAEGGVAIPLAPEPVAAARTRTASVALQVPAGMALTAWTFEPGIGAAVEAVDLEVGARWLGTWTPGDRAIEFPADAGVALAASAIFTARIAYRAPERAGLDYSRIRIWITNERRPKSIREVTVVGTWRPLRAVQVVAVRPANATGTAHVVVRSANGRAQPFASLVPPGHGPHPTYQLAQPVAVAAGARVETKGAVRLLYSEGAAAAARPAVRRRRTR